MKIEHRDKDTKVLPIGNMVVNLNDPEGLEISLMSAVIEMEQDPELKPMAGIWKILIPAFISVIREHNERSDWKPADLVDAFTNLSAMFLGFVVIGSAPPGPCAMENVKAIAECFTRALVPVVRQGLKVRKKMPPKGNGEAHTIFISEPIEC